MAAVEATIESAAEKTFRSIQWSSRGMELKRVFKPSQSAQFVVLNEVKNPDLRL
jgi:hypothetical protein